MKISATDTLNDTYARRLDRGKYLALGTLLCLVSAGWLGFIFHVAQNIPDLVSNIMYPLTSGVGAFWAFLTGYRAARGPVRLGLYISRRLIEAMGGKIWVESSGIPGEGSSFRVQLRTAE